MTDTEADRVGEFVRRGGGLLTASSGWVWRQYIAAPGQSLGADSLANRILGPVGFLIDDGSAGFTDRIAVSKPLAEAHWRIANRQQFESTETPLAGSSKLPESLRTFLLRQHPSSSRESQN